MTNRTFANDNFITKESSIVGTVSISHFLTNAKIGCDETTNETQMMKEEQIKYGNNRSITYKFILPPRSTTNPHLTNRCIHEPFCSLS